MVPPCREACLDLLEACVYHFLPILPKLGVITGKKLSGISKDELLKVANCSYLPPVNGSTPCFYKPVNCPAPPTVQNGFLLNTNNVTTSNSLGSQEEYPCLDDYVLIGNVTVTYQHSGQWSEMPKCGSRDQNLISPLLIVVPLLIMAFGIFMVVLARTFVIVNNPKRLQLNRHKDYDAFVCYNFDDDRNFVFDSILPELGDNHDPPLRMFLKAVTQNCLSGSPIT